MKIVKAAFILNLLVLVAPCVSGQRQCGFLIDTAKSFSKPTLYYFLTEIKSDTFKITNNKKDIPSFIKKQLDCFSGEFRIANPALIGKNNATTHSVINRNIE